MRDHGDSGRRRAVPGGRFRHLDATIAQLQEQMDAGRLSARGLTDSYLRRIRALDRRGPRLRSVLALNPAALADAAALDEERRRRGPRGALHGIPILVKDNIATAAPVPTTAGSLALAGVVARREAHLLSRLRAAGAVILGKTNLSEWANIRSEHSTSGWSAVGGLTRNPHALERNPSGSSSGSAVAIAANLAVAAIGTETDGSIVSPASANGVVGLKPTVGRVSRDGVIPISPTQDTAGPIARCVADAALMLGAMAGTDERDAATAAAPAFELERALDAGALRGARLGVVRAQFAANAAARDLMEDALGTLRGCGAELVEDVDLAVSAELEGAELDVLLHELRAALPQWLGEFAPHAPVRDLVDLIAWNERHREKELRWFGQELFERAAALRPLSDPRYRGALAAARRLAREEGIDRALRAQRLDALIAPTAGPAWITDLVNGDSHGQSFSTPAAVAGYPHLSVPAGLVHGLPVGLSFVGPAWSEPRLLAYAYAFEQASRARRAPAFALRAVCAQG